MAYRGHCQQGTEPAEHLLVHVLHLQRAAYLARLQSTYSHIYPAGSLMLPYGCT